jgi:hypothetical protein
VPVTARRGTTVVELVVALGLFGILSLAVVGVLRRTEDAYRAQTQRIDRRQSLRVAAAFLPAELRELDARDGDLIAMQPTAITIRAPRQFGVLCRVPALGPAGVATLVLRNAPSYGLRDFDADTDSLWLLSEGISAAPADDRWVEGDVVSVGSAPCADGRAGRRVTTALGPGDGFALGAPVLGFEVITYRLYRSSEDGRWYIGQQTATDFQPVLGPVTTNGLALAYFDSSGSVTTDPSRVSVIEVRVRAATIEPIRDGGGRLGRPVDSLVTVVALRNNRRR